MLQLMGPQAGWILLHALEAHVECTVVMADTHGGPAADGIGGIEPDEAADTGRGPPAGIVQSAVDARRVGDAL